MKIKKYFNQALFIFSVTMLGLSFSAGSVSADPAVTIYGDTDGNVAGEICWGCDTPGGGNGGSILDGLDIFGLPEGPDQGIFGIISNILSWLLLIFGVFGILGFVISGIWYLISAGDEGMAEKGKEGMKYSIIGVIVGLSGYVIMKAVIAMLGGDNARF